MTSPLFPAVIQIAEQFSAYVGEIEIPLLSSDFCLHDVLLSIRGGPVSPSGQSVNKLNLKFNDKDLTDAYIHAVRDSMAGLSPSVLEDSYRQGITRWGRVAKEFGVSRKEMDAALLMSAQDIVGRFTSIGDQGDGCLGNLHPFNYIYRYIPIPPVSLRGLLLSGMSGTVPADGVLRIENKPDATLISMAGAIRANCLLLFENPFVDVEKILQEIESVLSEIYELVIVNGPLYRKVSGLVVVAESLRWKVEETALSVGTPAQIGAILESLKEIKRIIDLRDE